MLDVLDGKKMTNGRHYATLAIVVAAAPRAGSDGGVPQEDKELHI